MTTMTTKEINRAAGRRLPWIHDLTDIDQLAGRIVIRRMTPELLEVEPEHTWGTGASEYERMVTVTLHARDGSLLTTVESGEHDMGSGSYQVGESIGDACADVDPAAVYWIARLDDTRDGRKNEHDVYLELWKPPKGATLDALLDHRAAQADALVEGYVEAPATDDEPTHRADQVAIARGRLAWWTREAKTLAEHSDDQTAVQTAVLAGQVWAAASVVLDALADPAR